MEEEEQGLLFSRPHVTINLFGQGSFHQVAMERLGDIPIESEAYVPIYGQIIPCMRNDA